MRIVSLLPSATEIVYALGLDQALVGVTFECDEPARARRDKLVVVGGADTTGMTPSAIDAQVRARLAAGEDLYTLHRDAFAALDPDLILTQDLCRVCAVPTGQVQDALHHLGCRADVLALDPHSLDEVLATIRTVAEHTGTTGTADDLLATLRSRLAAVAVAVAARPRPRVAAVEWVDPPGRTDLHRLGQAAALHLEHQPMLEAGEAAAQSFQLAPIVEQRVVAQPGQVQGAQLVQHRVRLVQHYCRVGLGEHLAHTSDGRTDASHNRRPRKICGQLPAAAAVLSRG